jgi:membrane protein DedA with SNARE-associated domain
LESFLSQALEITGTFNLNIAIILFLLCFFGEIWVGIPYVLETIWLLSGYQLAMRPSFIVDLLLIWLVSQAGRQVGSLTLYYSGIVGLKPLRRLYKKILESRLPRRQIVPSFVKNLLSNPSSFSVAVGRLFGLKLPMAIMMVAHRKLPQLALGVLMGSIIWDGLYIIIGRVIGPSLENKPHYLLLYSLAGLTVIYALTLGIKYIRKKRSSSSSDEIA